MPNHVRNVLIFRKLKPKEIDFIIDTIAVPHEDTYIIDFDKIIPEPKTEAECPKDCIVNKDSRIEEDADRPWFDWYKWHNKYWDTKWNAYDGYTKKGKTYVTFVFSTAWSMPHSVIERLRLLGYDFEHKYADEDLGSNCGILEYKSERWVHTL